jgi:hypothetical protein
MPGGPACVWGDGSGEGCRAPGTFHLLQAQGYAWTEGAYRGNSYCERHANQLIELASNAGMPLLEGEDL